METIAFRAVVRGNTKEGQRVRRVRVIEAPSFEEAWASFGAIEADMSKGLKDCTHTVLPPVGIKCNGQPSKGYELA